MRKAIKAAAMATLLAAALTIGSIPAMAVQGADITPPSLKGVTADRVTAMPTETVTIKVKASDNQSAVAYLSLRFRDPDTKRSLYAGELGSSCYNKTDGSYHVTMKIPVGTPAGNYQLYRVSLTDGAANRVNYRQEELLGTAELPSAVDYLKLEPELTIAVSEYEQIVDEDPPTLAGVEIGATYVWGGEAVRIQVDAADVGSGIKRIRVEFSCREDGTLYTLNLDKDDYNEERGSYAGWITIDRQELDGWYDLYSVSLTDVSGNRRIYGSDDLLYAYNDDKIEYEALPEEGLGFCVDTPARDE